MSGLGESVRHEWSGGVDLDDRELQEKYTQYQDLLDFVKEIGVSQRADHESVLTDLKRCTTLVNEYKEYLVPGKTF